MRGAHLACWHKALPHQLQSIWLWQQLLLVVWGVVALGGAERGEGQLWEFLG